MALKESELQVWQLLIFTIMCVKAVVLIESLGSRAMLSTRVCQFSPRSEVKSGIIYGGNIKPVLQVFILILRCETSL